MNTRSIDETPSRLRRLTANSRSLSRTSLAGACLAPFKSRLLLREIFLVGLALHLSANLALSVSAITPSGNLGTTVTTSGTTVDITGGTRNGTNLFHSFGLFNVDTGETANFQNDPSKPTTTNILGRVTGGQVSNIFGTIKTTDFGNASLYLMNPAGWVFGPTASLNVGGSFHVTTADYLRLGTGNDFFYADLTNTSTLSSAPVSAFGFFDHAPKVISFNGTIPTIASENPVGPITIDKSVIDKLQPGSTLSIIGGDITIQGTTPRVSNLFVPRGQINIASVASMGEVPVDGNFSRSSFSALGTVDIGAGALLNKESGQDPSAAVHILGGAIKLTGQAEIVSLSTAAGRGGDIEIKGDSLEMQASSIQTANLASQSAGNISIDVANFSMTGGAAINSAAFALGKGGTITINANHAATISGPGTSVFSSTLLNGVGGDIKVTADTLTLADHGLIQAASGFLSGAGGNVYLNVNNLSVAGGASVSSQSRGFGAGGNIEIKAKDSATISGERSGIFSDSSGDGPAGEISFCAGALTVTNKAAIESGFVVQEGAGITIQADNITISDRGTISTRAFSNDVGQITITARNGGTLAVDGGSIEAATVGPGAAGNIVVDVGTLLLNGGGQIANSSALGATGSSGDQIITATSSVSISGSSPDGKSRSLFNTDPSSGLFSISDNVGFAGNINVTTPTLHVTDGGKITTDATKADGGNIVLNVGNLVNLFYGQITTSVGTGKGKGGNITIDPQFVVLNQSQIAANAFGGPGGNIKIVADTFLASPDSSVTASSALSTPGTVDIQAAITNISGLLEPLPENIFQATSLLQQSCATRFSEGKLSSLVVSGRDGLPLEPGTFMPSPLYRLAEQPNPSINQGSPGIESSQLALAMPKFSLNGPCTK